MTRSPRPRQLWCVLLVLIGGLAAGPATSQPAAPPAPPPRPQVDSSTIATTAESAQITLRQMEAVASEDRVSLRVQAELPTLASEIDARVDETSNLLASNASLQVLDGLDQDWQTIGRELDGRWHALDHRRATLESMLRPGGPDGKPPPPGQLAAMEGPWKQSAPAFDYYAAHPKSDAMRDRMYDAAAKAADVLQQIDQTRTDVTAQYSDTYGLLNAIDVQRARVQGVMQDVREARDQAWSRLFQRDGAPIWALGRHHPTTAGAAATHPGQGTFGRQMQAVRAYVARHQQNVALHLGLIAALTAGLMIARRWVRRWAEADPSLKRATLAFTAPFATALVLSFLAAVWIYPQAPRLFWAGLGAAALLPTVYLLRRVVEPRLFLILDALVVFYALDQVRTVTASFPLLTRLLFLAEMLGGSAVLWLLMRARRDVVPADVFGWVVHIGVRIWLAVFAACLLTDAVGNVSLADLVGGAALGGGYLAVILYACTRIVGGVLILLLRSRPLVLLNGVRRHQPLLLGRLTGLVDWVAAAFWVLAVMAMLSARPAVFAAAYWFWYRPVGFGAIRFTPSHLIVFALTVWAAFLVSRFVQFVLDEDVYTHVHLAGGLSYAINRLVHYAVVVAGFYVAIAAAGVPLTQLSLLVGALTVGLGFGLQNVVNNFVSGLILLFERPIKVGDLIQMSDSTAGTVEYIGIRASIIRSTDSSDVIVPNGNLISNQLTNWTLNNRQRGITIPVAVGPETDPPRVMALLAGVAAAHPLVVASPPPVAFLIKFGADSFSYELHAWTNSADQWVQIRSDLSVALHGTLVREGITIK